MKKCYYLSTCSTCTRILKEWNLGSDYVLQDIKTEPMTESQVDEMIALAGSAESLFSRRAQKYKIMELGDKTLAEKDYRQLIIDEYTFLKRPVLISGDNIFIGNAKKTIQEALDFLNA